ncbi:MAG: response regulator [Chloroflexota bacterium]|nr:response regulator [Chloroflexota bacterium]
MSQPRVKPARNERAKAWTILIIDDTPDNLTVASVALEFHGAHVVTAASADDGFAQLEQISPTCILLDIRMPKVDGWAVFKTLRSTPATAHIPIVALTAYAMQGDREKIIQAGFDGYIAKPIDILTFVDHLDKILQSRPQLKGDTP